MTHTLLHTCHNQSCHHGNSLERRVGEVDEVSEVDGVSAVVVDSTMAANRKK